jgi:Fe2+ transport system protein B
MILMEKENSKADMRNPKKELNEFKNPMRVNLLSTEDLNNFIENLNKPNFLGSVHFNRDENSTRDTIEKQLINSVGTNKLSESIKSTLFNPITKVLILAWIVFNIFWLVFAYLL